HKYLWSSQALQGGCHGWRPGPGETTMGPLRPMAKIRNTPIRTWEAGDNVQGFALLTKKELRQDRNGKSFLDLELADASGSIVAKVWSDSPALQAQFEIHRFVAFKGSVKSYRDQLQLSVDDCREACEDDRRFGFDE